MASRRRRCKKVKSASEAQDPLQGRRKTKLHRNRIKQALKAPPKAASGSEVSVIGCGTHKLSPFSGERLQGDKTFIAEKATRESLNHDKRFVGRHFIGQKFWPVCIQNNHILDMPVANMRLQGQDHPLFQDDITVLTKDRFLLVPP